MIHFIGTPHQVQLRLTAFQILMGQAVRYLTEDMENAIRLILYMANGIVAI